MAIDKRKNRSDAYQHLLVEIACSNEMLSAFSDDDSLHKKLNPFDYNEKINELQDELKKEVWILIEEHLTPRQKDVIRLFVDGYTQMEIAKILNVNQSSVTKSLNGNVDYKKGKDKNGKDKASKRIYGGILRKVQKLIAENNKITEILNKISDIRDERWL